MYACVNRYLKSIDIREDIRVYIGTYNVCVFVNMNKIIPVYVFAASHVSTQQSLPYVCNVFVWFLHMGASVCGCVLDVSGNNVKAPLIVGSFMQ